MSKIRDRRLPLPFPHLRFSPSILKRLGEELNPNPDHGLLELVKNAYDADARHCTIALVNTHERGGQIVITDDGDGMSREAIEDQWLVVGRSSKSSDKPTRLGRIPVGNKGLGRLAALRLGSKVTVATRPENEPESEYVVEIDWDAFEHVSVVEEVEVDIVRRKRSKKADDGTVIQLSGLRCHLSRMDVKRLARGILLLADPFDESPTGFSPKLLAPEFQDLERLVQRRYFDDAEFHLIAEVDDNGQARASVVDWKGNILFAASHEDLSERSGRRKYGCPPAVLDLWIFLLSKQRFSARATTLDQVREWLREFGGVHLYLRGIRVAPYGNPGNDWLEINLSRVRSPEERPSTNTSIGRVTLNDLGDQLLQKTDRSGLVENEAFEELKRFATEALNWMARRRLDEAERRRQTERRKSPKKVAAARHSLGQAIDQLPQAAKAEIEGAVKRYAAARDREAAAWQEEVLLYRTLSTAGITAAVFAHESKQPLRLIKQNARQIERTGRKEFGNPFQATLGAPIERIQRQAESLEAFGNLTLSQLDHEKRRPARVDVHQVIERVVGMFAAFARQRGVELRMEMLQGGPYLRASEAAIEATIANPIANSLKAFEKTPPGKHEVLIRTEVTGDLLTVRILDNGPGIQEISVRDVWLPGETTYPNGTGLGLTIVRDTVRDLGGTVDAIAKGELGGAEIVVELPILGV